MDRAREARAALKEAGLKVTAERTALMAALMATRHPASTRELLLSVDGMDRTTVYRNLQGFVRAGIARKVDVGHRHAHFESALGVEHHHLICGRCGKVEDVSFCPDPVLQAAMLRKSSFSSIESHTLEFRGTCKACARKSA